MPAYIDEERLARVQEQALSPELPIVDPHHHLIDQPVPYPVGKWIADLRCGHKIVASVHMEAHGHYWESGPDHLKAAGETEYVARQFEQVANSLPGMRFGVVGGGDLSAGKAKVDELLDAHASAGRGLFRGIRINPFWSFQADASMVRVAGWDTVAEDAHLAEGVQCLAARGLCLELVSYHADLPIIARLAKKFPDLLIVCDHLAIFVDRGASAPSESELLAQWKDGIDGISRAANIRLKLGGCANPYADYSLSAIRALREREMPSTSAELADAYSPLVSYAVEKLGPERCMFESNFPIDKNYTSYVVLWNAFKRLAQAYSADEARLLLSGTANTTYKLGL
jgi:L-fuconolactonase